MQWAINCRTFLRYVVSLIVVANSSQVGVLSANNEPQCIPEYFGSHISEAECFPRRGKLSMTNSSAGGGELSRPDHNKQSLLSAFPTFPDESSNSCPALNFLRREQGQSGIDEELDALIDHNAILKQRYVVLQRLGWGTYGTVVEAHDTYLGDKCAIKLMPIISHNRDNAEWELRNLRRIAEDDRYKHRHVVALRDHFEFGNFVCLVTNLLGQSLGEYISQNDSLPLVHDDLRRIGFQLLRGVEFIHSLGLVHTDLKSDNILLSKSECPTDDHSCSPSYSSIVNGKKVLQDATITIIDFGSAYFESDRHDSVVTTNNYRAPEIMWGLEWSYPIDIWSVGCVLVELFTGHLLFLAHDDAEQLRAIEGFVEYLANIETSKTDKEDGNFHEATNIFDHVDGDSKTTYRSRGMRKFHDALSLESQSSTQFVDLLKLMFVRSRAARITASDALKHPWFAELLKEIKIN